jgi:hypothetical protein
MECCSSPSLVLRQLVTSDSGTPTVFHPKKQDGSRQSVLFSNYSLSIPAYLQRSLSSELRDHLETHVRGLQEILRKALM